MLKLNAKTRNAKTQYAKTRNAKIRPHNYGKKYLFRKKTMEKGVFFSPKYYGNYGKIILKMSGHPDILSFQRKMTL